MTISYDGIGQWSATFFNEGVREGELVKTTEYGFAVPCEKGDDFMGVALAAGEVEEPCTVQLGGLVSMRYKCAKIETGWRKLAADGEGGVELSETGHMYLVVATNTGLGQVTFKL